MQKKNGKPDEVSANFHDLIEVIRLKWQTDIEKESAMVHSISTIQASSANLLTRNWIENTNLIGPPSCASYF